MILLFYFLFLELQTHINIQMKQATIIVTQIKILHQILGKNMNNQMKWFIVFLQILNFYMKELVIIIQINTSVFIKSKNIITYQYKQLYKYLNDKEISFIIEVLNKLIDSDYILIEDKSIIIMIKTLIIKKTETHED